MLSLRLYVYFVVLGALDQASHIVYVYQTAQLLFEDDVEHLDLKYFPLECALFIPVWPVSCEILRAAMSRRRLAKHRSQRFRVLFLQALPDQYFSKTEFCRAISIVCR